MRRRPRLSSGSLPRPIPCSKCGRGVPDPRCGEGICRACYCFGLYRAFHELPIYPQKLEVGEGEGRAETLFCKHCQRPWPLKFMFKDSRGQDKCVICRRWELQNDVELNPSISIQMHLAVGAGNPIECFECHKKFGKEAFMVEGSRSRDDRLSMFCAGCRAVEERYIHQGFLDVNE